MKLWLSFILLAFVLFSCSKARQVYKGKYLEKGCWDVVQIIEPADERFKESVWIMHDSTYTGIVSASGVLERYKTGQPFYFTVRSIAHDLPHTLVCAMPKYAVVIDASYDSPPE